MNPKLRLARLLRPWFETYNTEEDPPTALEVFKAAQWRVRFAIFLCLVAFATIFGVLGGWLKP